MNSALSFPCRTHTASSPSSAFGLDRSFPPLGQPTLFARWMTALLPGRRPAIAFASVIIANFWCSKCVPTLNADPFTSVAPGAALDSPSANTTWVLFAPLMLVTRVLIIFPWRILAKRADPAVLLPAPLRACNGICARPAAHAALGAEMIVNLAVVNEDAGMVSSVDSCASIGSTKGKC
ncbi:hypothetical protein EDB87DRAFT_1665511, partial [Lactarius vividus]